MTYEEKALLIRQSECLLDIMPGFRAAVDCKDYAEMKATILALRVITKMIAVTTENNS